MNAVVYSEISADHMAARLKLAKWIGYLALLDLLIFPYFQLVILPFSLPLVLLSLFGLNTTFRKDYYLLLFLVLALSAIASAGVGFFLPTQDYFSENVKRLIQLFSAFAYFFYFRWLASRVPLRIAPIVWLFIVWFAALALAFYLQPDLVGELIRTVYGRLVTSEDTLAEHLRFAYLFTDPNTAGYFLLVAASVLFMQRRSTPRLLAIVALLTPLVFVTQSRGAMLSLAFMFAATLYPPKMLASLLSARKAIVLLVLAAILYGAFVYVKSAAEDSTGVVKMAYERFFEDPEQYATAGSRVEVWKRFASNLLPYPFGRGYTLVVEGAAQGTHSDVLRLAYSHGTIALVAAMMFFFRRALSFTPLIIPALVAFLINSLLDEQKLLALFLALLAVCVGSEERQKAAA